MDETGRPAAAASVRAEIPAAPSASRVESVAEMSFCAESAPSLSDPTGLSGIEFLLQISFRQLSHNVHTSVLDCAPIRKMAEQCNEHFHSDCAHGFSPEQRLAYCCILSSRRHRIAVPRSVATSYQRLW